MISATKAPRPVESNLDVFDEAGIRPVCPRCRHGQEHDSAGCARFPCRGCGFEPRESAGFLDLRTASDRYLSLNQETRKASKLAAFEPVETLEGLARRYYRMTADVSRQREERFVRHILDAKSRGLAILARLPQAGAILDVGCGTGGFVAAAAEVGRQAVGIDIASRWLVVARKRLAPARNPGVSRNDRQGRPTPGLFAASAENLPFADDSFPIVVADSLLEHVADPVRAMSEMIRVLQPGGTLVVWFPNRLWPGPDPHVGLCGLPLLPRSLASRYVAARRGPVFWPRCGTCGEWANLARGIDRRLEVRTQAADLSAWPSFDRSNRARSARLLGRLSRISGPAAMLRAFGPIGELVVRKPASVNSPSDARRTKCGCLS